MEDDMESPQDEAQNEQKHLRRGRILGSLSILFSIALGAWQAYLLPIVNSLSAQGRMNEGDSDGCFYGLLYMLTIFISPLVTLIALVLGGIGFRLKARTLAIIALIIALLTLIPMLPAWVSFFGS